MACFHEALLEIYGLSCSEITQTGALHTSTPQMSEVELRPDEPGADAAGTFCAPR